mmetsp:Transcript_53935/g.96567  ORF Transcript_53935/g.96567 Transcript_53935/m.96567 type:complete len:690 (+) Transcript_53935:44-2113(+)
MLPSLPSLLEEDSLSAASSLPLSKLQALSSSEGWETWLQQLAGLNAASARSQGLWEFLLSLFTASVGNAAQLALSLAAPALRCLSEGCHPAALSSTLAAAGKVLAEAASCSQLALSSANNLVDGFIASAWLLKMTKSQADAPAAEAWLTAAIALGCPLSQLSQECFALADVAEADSAAVPLLNVAWKLIKSVCMAPSCNMAVTSVALARAAAGCAKALTAAGQEQASRIARFHCSNFVRLMKEAPALSLEANGTGQEQEDFPLAAVLQATSPYLRGTSHELLDKVLTQSLERWAACHKQHPSDDIIDGLALLSASSAPGVLPKLLSWTVGEDAAFYSLALRIHQLLPSRMGAERALSWAQLLFDRLLLARGVEAAEAGRAECQAASCIAVLIAACPAECAAPWVQHALSPLSVRGKSSPALWTLARRLCRALSGQSRGGLAQVAAAAEEVLRPETFAACGWHGCLQRLRCLAVLVRSGEFGQEKLKEMAGELQILLGSDRVPLQGRIEAWAVHGECCIELGENAAKDFSVSVRYAIKHLASVDAAGARVASVVSRVPGTHLTSAVPNVIKGLCCMDWPLRAVGLSAAAAATARQDAPADVHEIACSAVSAFEQEHGVVVSDRPSGWMAENSSAVAYRRKRRRLLESLTTLPETFTPCTETEDVEDNLPELCAAARAKIDMWLSEQSGGA